jgi:hypothetical protein
MPKKENTDYQYWYVGKSLSLNGLVVFRNQNEIIIICLQQSAPDEFKEKSSSPYDKSEDNGNSSANEQENGFRSGSLFLCLTFFKVVSKQPINWVQGSTQYFCL